MQPSDEASSSSSSAHQPLHIYPFVFLQRNPLVWLTEESALHQTLEGEDGGDEGAEVGTVQDHQHALTVGELQKRKLAKLLDVRLGTLKFPSKVSLKALFRFPSSGSVPLDLLVKERQSVVLLIDPSLARSLATHPDRQLISALNSKSVMRLSAFFHQAQPLVLLQKNPTRNSCVVMEELERRRLARLGTSEDQPLLIESLCHGCNRTRPIAGEPKEAQGLSLHSRSLWRCNACRGDPENCRLARRAIATFRLGTAEYSTRSHATLLNMLVPAIKQGLAERTALVASALSPLTTGQYLENAIKARRLGVVASVLSATDPKCLSTVLAKAATRWQNDGLLFGEIRTLLKEAQEAARGTETKKGNASEASARWWLILCKRAGKDAALPIRLTELVASFVFSRDAERLIHLLRGVLLRTECMLI
uniref:Uncharacterized protein n=1 Tax=Chromera velia CCMP2878 TaxID=1169474 RepID=A0A0G4FA72_9ALVE|eukprot:Cvel_2980.t1-p1 / transcript=Cvel_2980.t1 / gene=Cvel_2980 / organism=Chromera_velia_CCMP2878 / gene_product=hypothetical protein / transcript_product=hypothetical protein / location=Cvel_scaffold118:74214-75473(+) / protein_length=420 / sequence_SO=supercontig / SO=protein_coding / is_pseudo=false